MRTVLRSVSLLVLAGAALSTQAVVLFDNTASSTGTTFRTVDAPALTITNTNSSAISLSSVSFLGEVTSAQDLKFFLADSSGTILNSVTGAYAATSGFQLVGSSVNWTLGAGQTYFIGAIYDGTGVNYRFEFPNDSTPQNGLVSSNNGNFDNFANPSFLGTAGAEMSWKLEGSNITSTPGPLAALPFALMAIKRRRKA